MIPKYQLIHGPQCYPVAEGRSQPEILRLYGTEEQCEAALEQARCPYGYQCSRCNFREYGLDWGRRLKRYQGRSSSYQAKLTAGTEMQTTKLTLTS